MNFFQKLLLFLLSGVLLFSCLRSEYHPDILILYTNDEHGHLEEQVPNWAKAVNLTEKWEQEKAQCKKCAVFILSGGDNFTGSAISSVVHGESVAHFMKIVGYDVSAVGNHEFDYGINEWKKNQQISSVHYLSANLVDKKHSGLFTASTVLNKEGISIGFVGATTEELLSVTVSHTIKQFTLLPSYLSVSRALKTIPKRTPTIFLTHQSFENSKKWVDKLSRKPLVVFNGHTHKKYIKKESGTTFIQSGKFLKKYAKVILRWKEGRYQLLSAELVDIPKKIKTLTNKAQIVQQLLHKYENIVKKKAGAPLISVTKEISKEEFMKVHTCGVLDEYKEADVVMSNPGGYRDDIHRGTFREYDLISVLPFENRVVFSRIKGKYLPYNLERAENAVCGAEKKGKSWFVKGERIEAEKHYTAVIHDFILEGGDEFKFLQPSTENKILADGWRKPIILYLQRKSKEKKTMNQLLK
ncbi:5'-nucleotidase C-terminal domain-containing protein [bacterium]|nr:5'-nucleotidase C-terminal domain-containing protein [bacterium]